jgi:hypothetical protein
MEEIKIIARVSNDVPFFRYATAALGLLAILSLISHFAFPTINVPFVWIIVLFILTVLFYGMSILASVDAATQHPILKYSAYAVVVTILLLVSLSFILIFTSIFADWPKPSYEIFRFEAPINFQVDKIKENQPPTLTKLGLLKIDENGHDFVRGSANPNIGTFLLNAKSEFFYLGPSLHITVDVHREMIKNVLKKGIRFKLLLFDFTDSLSNYEMTTDIKEDPASFKEDMKNGLKKWEQIRKNLPQELRPNLEIKLMKSIPKDRFYIIDPSDTSSFTYYIPHPNRVEAISTLGLLLQNKSNGIFSRYYEGIKECWTNAVPFEQWLVSHPDYE